MIELLSEAEDGIHKADWLAIELEAVRIGPPASLPTDDDEDVVYICVVFADPEAPSSKDTAIVIDTQELLEEYASVDDGRRQWLEVSRVGLVTYLMALEGQSYEDLVAIGIIHDGDPFTATDGEGADNE